MRFLEVLQKIGKYETIDDVKEYCCIHILTEFVQYNFCFIDFETDEFLGIYYTAEDFTEKFVLLSKKYIVSMSLVYQQDLNFSEEPKTISYFG